MRLFCPTEISQDPWEFQITIRPESSGDEDEEDGEMFYSMHCSSY